ncbi:unnamed protein product [Strongylus vulgaris]|uniref:SCP domain-containing protein n=1 Tax=Strongylus vulgaris TaxID=40348 RepID=A0A3P7J0F0_STRVU|nr:unnamed protein product [Strongylus vulgaris]
MQLKAKTWFFVLKDSFMAHSRVLTVAAVTNKNIEMAALNAHNYYRTILANGTVSTSIDQLPKANYMIKLKWDDSLAKKADGFGCNDSVNATVKYPAGKSNIAWIEGDRAKLGEEYRAVAAAVHEWWNPVYTSTLSGRNLRVTKKLYKELPKFVKIAFAYNEKVGCAVNSCDDKALVRCIYDYVPTVKTMPLYVKGKVCELCTETGERCEASLCVVEDEEEEEEED